MEKHPVKIKLIEHVTHDVLKIVTENPEHIEFIPGQATEIFIDKTGWESEGRPFTFTCLPDEDYLEFMIKTYPDNKGVTNELLQLQKGDRLFLNDIFGVIHYQGEGTFIAGGAGITPFISIFRDLKAKNKIGNNRLLFANKTKADIILKQEFEEMLGMNFINILSDEKIEEYAYGRITEDFIKESNPELNGYFYLCGPPPMMESVEAQLAQLGIHENLIVKEEF